MSVDYTANYGIGYEVKVGDIEEAELEDGLLEYIECNLSDGFECFENGNQYTGSMGGVFVGLKKPFKDGLDLTPAKQRLDDELKRLNLVAVSEFDEIGGLLVW